MIGDEIKGLNARSRLGRRQLSLFFVCISPLRPS